MTRTLAILAFAATSLAAQNTIRLGPGDYRWIPFNVRHPPAEVDCSYQVTSGGPTVHVELMPGSEFRLFARGREHDSLTTTPDAAEGEFRQIVLDPGRYAIVVSNRDNAAPVTVAMHFETNLNPTADMAQTLSPLRRFTVILVSIAVFFGMVTWSVSSLLKAARRG